VSVTVCIPSIPTRAPLAARALRSVLAQTRPPDAIAVSIDWDRLGAAGNRDRAWRMAGTEWVAFLDDDDELLPEHLEHLLDVAQRTGADVVYPWHRIIGPDGVTQLPDLLGAQGKKFDPDEFERRNYIPITVLVRRSLLVEVDGFPEPCSAEWPYPDNEDWGLWRRLVAAGAVFHHTPQVTWIWHHHGRNTSGRTDRW
jgi:glycosyltransferase involved in cell wall biosynthesis